jgi:ComF family protein
MLRAAADTLLSFLLAPPCAVCHDVLDRPLAGAVCDRCWASVHVQPACFSMRTIRVARALGPYEGTLRDILHALKYDGRRSIAPRLAGLMAQHGRDALRGADVAVPVPLHRRRQRERGFNQADDLARGLGCDVAHLLTRVRATCPQVDLPASKRRANVRDAFAVTRRNAGSARGLVVVLVDDVATTGATLEACASALIGCGVREVRALTAARVET